MLTGDKEETAINIGRSCNLILPLTKLFFLVKINNEEQYIKTLKDIYMDIQTYTNGNGKAYKDPESGNIIEIALVMDGPSFLFFNNNSVEQRKWLLRIGKKRNLILVLLK